MSWARGAGGISNHGGANRGLFHFTANPTTLTVTVAAGTVTSGSGGGGTTDGSVPAGSNSNPTVANTTQFDWLQLHGIAFYIIWGYLSFTMIITGRHLKQFPRVRMIIHIIVGTLLFALTVLFSQFERRKNPLVRPDAVA
jgi:hypothetical protein